MMMIMMMMMVVFSQFRVGLEYQTKLHFKPHEQNRILVPLRTFFQIFRRALPSFLYRIPPPS